MFTSSRTTRPGTEPGRLGGHMTLSMGGVALFNPLSRATWLGTLAGHREAQRTAHRETRPANGVRWPVLIAG
ncbi:MAG: hypothetical protein ACQRW7_11365 [Caulobacterales bacterium]|uniref:hypothetical protein n=1 Tax=Glycocaulis sp. TaxID=1969725 RepID=UPI003FA07E16